MLQDVLDNPELHRGTESCATCRDALREDFTLLYFSEIMTLLDTHLVLTPAFEEYVLERAPRPLSIPLVRALLKRSSLTSSTQTELSNVPGVMPRFSHQLAGLTNANEETLLAVLEHPLSLEIMGVLVSSTRTTAKIQEVLLERLAEFEERERFNLMLLLLENPASSLSTRTQLFRMAPEAMMQHLNANRSPQRTELGVLISELFAEGKISWFSARWFSTDPIFEPNPSMAPSFLAAVAPEELTTLANTHQLDPETVRVLAQDWEGTREEFLASARSFGSS